MLKIFIADDSDLVRERLVAMISELEAVELVGQAADARAALEGIRGLKPDVAILDIRMPGGNGIQALKALRASGAATIIIILTAFPYPQHRKKCLDSGADFFFDKSTEFDCVAQVIQKLQRESLLSV